MKLRICTAVIALLIGATAGAAEPGHEWSYSGPTGPEHWADQSPEFATCGIGKHQSPIDIEKTEKAALPPIEFHYQPAPLTVIDTGHSVQVNYAPGSTITIAGETYTLVQFHFHKPSEEKVHDRPFAMVAHLVHKNAKGELAVVAVELKPGKPNPVLDAVLGNVPHEKGKETTVAGRTINVANLIPASHGYYTFPGSLTTPPCSEDVTWFVLKTPVEVSAAEIAKFGKHYAHNARPVQPLNGRVVRETLD